MAKTLDELESAVPALAITAVKDAYRRALASGLTVKVSSNGALYEVKPDGSKVRLKSLKPEVRVKRGAKYRVK